MAKDSAHEAKVAFSFAKKKAKNRKKRREKA